MEFEDLADLDEQAIDNILHDVSGDDLLGLVDDTNWPAMSHAVEHLSATHDPYENDARDLPESVGDFSNILSPEVSRVGRTSKRSYNIEKARESRERNKIIRQQGIMPPPPYKPKNAQLELVRQQDGTVAWLYTQKRKYTPSGRYVGANIKKGGRTRKFSTQNAPMYGSEQSKFFKENFKENIAPNLDPVNAVDQAANALKTKQGATQKRRRGAARRGGTKNQKTDG